MVVPASGQKVLDSLQRQLNRLPANTQSQADVLNSLGYEYWIVDSQKSMAFGNRALEVSRKISYKPGEAKARRVLGVACWTLGESKPALENLTASQELYKSLGDEEGEANCELNIGMVYADIRDYDTALKFYEKAIEKFTSLGLKGRIATAYTKIGTVMIDKGQLADAQEYLTNALKFHSQNDFTYGKAEAHNRLGRLYLESGEPEQAGYHLRKAVVYGKQVNDKDGLVGNLILFARLLRMQGDYEAAEAHLEIALDKARLKHQDKYRLEAYKEFRELREKQGRPDDALKYYDAFSALKDSIYTTDKSKELAALEFRNELETLKSSASKNVLIRWILLVAIAIISLLSLLLIRSLRLKNKKQYGKLASSHSVIETERRKQAELEEQLHFKSRELTSYALNFVQKNEVLELVQDKVSGLKDLPQQRLPKAIQEIEGIIRSHKNLEKDWEDFKVHFEQVHSDFFINLHEKFPQLSANDHKVAALARLNLNIKESSNILGISPDSVKTARYRLRKKLGIEPEADLMAFLMGLDSKQSNRLRL